MDIISMAQQANPNPSGQIELLRAQFTALSSVVKIMPSSSRSLPKSSGLLNVTCLPRDVLICASRVFWHRASSETNRRILTLLNLAGAHAGQLLRTFWFVLRGFGLLLRTEQCLRTRYESADRDF